jgi:hypothetical protein
LPTFPTEETNMPRAEILSKQAMHTLTENHAELAGKIETNRRPGDKLRSQMVQVEAVMKMLEPDFNARAISAKRRNTGNPWFKRGTLYRSAVDVLRRAASPITARRYRTRTVGRKDSHGLPEAGGSPTGRHPCCAAGAERENRDWRECAR